MKINIMDYKPCQRFYKCDATPGFCEECEVFDEYLNLLHVYNTYEMMEQGTSLEECIKILCENVTKAMEKAKYEDKEYME